MNWARAALVSGTILGLSGCYHQVVETGLPAGNTGVTKGYYSSWVFGLVAGTPLDVRTLCPNGVAFVSTRWTVGNYFGSLVTLGIWTPHELKVTCASRAAAMSAQETRVLAANATEDQAARLMQDVIALVSSTGRTVAITIEPGATAADSTGGR